MARAATAHARPAHAAHPATRVEHIDVARILEEIDDELDITTLTDLETAATSGRLRELPGIKAVTEQKILHGIAALRGHAARWRLDEADASVRPLVAHLQASAVSRLTGDRAAVARR